jgi:hypothetical protein
MCFAYVLSLIALHSTRSLLLFGVTVVAVKGDHARAFGGG